MSRRHLIMLLGLAAIWGSSFMFIKVAVRDLEPTVLVAGRLLLGVLTLALVTVARRQWREAIAEIRGSALPLVILGVLNTVVPFWLLSWGETRIDSGLAALLQASAPLFTVLLAFFFVRHERLGGLRLVGFVTGFVGVALLVGAVPSGDILAALAVVATGLCYAAAALYGGRHMRSSSPALVAFGATLFATLISLPFGLAQLPSQAPGWKALASVAFLGVVGLGFAYLLYFGIIGGAGPSRAILVTYLVPPLALAYGAIFLDEHVSLADLGGLALILAGVALGTGTVRAFRRRRRDAAAEAAP
jgi:drug/metabolite transporter (DMT)-like permease